MSEGARYTSDNEVTNAVTCLLSSVVIVIMQWSQLWLDSSFFELASPWLEVSSLWLELLSLWTEVTSLWLEWPTPCPEVSSLWLELSSSWLKAASLWLVLCQEPCTARISMKARAFVAMKSCTKWIESVRLKTLPSSIVGASNARSAGLSWLWRWVFNILFLYKSMA